jgi:hypothetical protein
MKTSTMPVMHSRKGGVRCGRCGGLMVPEYIAELNEECWKCVVCGERVDPLILAHREEGAGVRESPELKPSIV